MFKVRIRIPGGKTNYVTADSASEARVICGRAQRHNPQVVTDYFDLSRGER